MTTSTAPKTRGPLPPAARSFFGRLRRSRTAIRAAACAALGMAGMVGLHVLASAKQPPVAVERQVAPIHSKTLVAARTSVQPVLTGFGDVQPVRRVDLVAETAGRILHVHPALRAGERVRVGESLLRIDPREAQSRVAELEAVAATARIARQRLDAEHSAQTQRLDLLRRSLELADAQHARLRQLHEGSDVGSRSAVEAAERERLALAEQVLALQTDVDLYSLKADDLDRQALAAEAQLDRARLEAERCDVAAPFDARILKADVEAGQWTSPGQPLVSLADDSLREIHVSLDAAQAFRHLEFQPQETADAGWFPLPVPAECGIRLTGVGGDLAAAGRLHRVVRFDRASRMLTVAVRVDSSASDGGWPLAEGMFCRVEIPGRALADVVPVPRHALTPRQEVYVAENGVLRIRPVVAAYLDDQWAYLSAGIEEGEIVLTSRLVNPMENAPVAGVEETP